MLRCTLKKLHFGLAESPGVAIIHRVRSNCGSATQSCYLGSAKIGVQKHVNKKQDDGTERKTMNWVIGISDGDRWKRAKGSPVFENLTAAMAWASDYLEHHPGLFGEHDPRGFTFRRLPAADAAPARSDIPLSLSDLTQRLAFAPTFREIMAHVAFSHPRQRA